MENKCATFLKIISNIQDLRVQRGIYFIQNGK